MSGGCLANLIVLVLATVEDDGLKSETSSRNSSASFVRRSFGLYLTCKDMYFSQSLFGDCSSQQGTYFRYSPVLPSKDNSFILESISSVRHQTINRVVDKPSMYFYTNRTSV